MKKVAFIFSHGPQTTSAGREGLDIIISMISINDKIGLFFIQDGIFQLFSLQKPEKIFVKNHIKTFNILNFFKIKNIYICKYSLFKRGFLNYSSWILPVKILNIKSLTKILDKYDFFLTF